MSIHIHPRGAKVTVALMHILSFDLTHRTRTAPKDIISKPQLVLSVQRDVHLLLYSYVIDKCLQRNGNKKDNQHSRQGYP